MLFWIIIALAALFFAAWIAWPYLAKGSIVMNDAEGAISVFRDQMDEVDHDLAQGLINEGERDAAHREIEQRALRAARDLDGGMIMSKRSMPAAVSLVGVVAVASVWGYAILGEPQIKDRPLASRQAEILQMQAAAGNTQSKIALLLERTKDNPASFNDWWELANAYAAVGDHASSVSAFQKAAELNPETSGVQSAYAEAMVLANGNKVPPAARIIFEQILTSEDDARARYYIALAKAQGQDFEGAMDDWVALTRDFDARAPWMPLVRRDIVNMARFLKKDVRTYLPDASAQEITKAGGTPTKTTGAESIEDLRTALDKDPKTFESWIRLATLLAEKGDADSARAALDEAKTHYATAPFVLQQLDKARSNLGLTENGTRGPTDEDIANASELSDEEQADMIDGMVASLAGRLEDNPDNPDGWIMLIRSYAVIGAMDKAKESYRTAMAHFEGDPAVLRKLKTEAGLMVGE